MIMAHAPGAASTRPSRERTNESKSAEEMDARDVRGRTALVRLRKRLYRAKSRLPGIFCYFC